MSDKNGKKKNVYTIRYGNADGEMRCGQVTSDNEISAFLIRSGFFHNHYISLDGTGDRHRQGGTIGRSPGSFQVQAGAHNGTEDQSIFMRAENGDVFISAPNGKIILDAKSILIKAQGDGGGTGTIELDANERVNIVGHGDGVKINGTSGVRIASDKTVDILGQTMCNIYGGFIDMADGNSTSAAGKPSKTGEKATSALDAFGFLDAITGAIGLDMDLESRMNQYGSLFKKS